MKTRELLKLNERYSIVEATYEHKDTEYVVCSNYNPDAEPYRQWDSGIAYCLTLEEAVKVAAKNCFDPMYIYVVIECYNGNIEQRKFSTYENARRHFSERFDSLKNEEGITYYSMLDNYKGELVAQLDWGDDETTSLKLIEFKI